MSMKLITSTFRSLFFSSLNFCMNLSAPAESLILWYENVSCRRKRSSCVFISGPSLRFLPSSSSSSTHSSGNICAIFTGISPLKIALRAYCVAVGSMLMYVCSSMSNMSPISCASTRHWSKRKLSITIMNTFSPASSSGNTFFLNISILINGRSPSLFRLFCGFWRFVRSLCVDCGGAACVAVMSSIQSM